MSANQESPNLSVGTVIADRYHLLQKLGQREFGQTFLAIDQSQAPETFCVIKSVLISAIDPTINPAINLLQIPQTPRCLEQFTQDETIYQVWEYIAGDNLATTLREKGTYTVPEIWQILTSLLPVLQHIHSYGVIHGDIKPENIICCTPPEPNTKDFVLVGLEAIEISPVITPITSTITGSPAYAAPEQLRGKPTFASDLYSLGVVCVYLLTGIHPFNLFDSTTHQWTWQNYWLPEVNPHHQPPADWERQRLAQFLDRLIEPALNQPFGKGQEPRYNSALAAMNRMQELQGKTKIPLAKFMNTSPGNCVATLRGHQGLFAGVNALALAADCQTLASASDDKTIRLWDLPTGQARSILRGHSNFVKSVAFHPTQPHLLASGSKDRTIKLWDTNTGELLQTLTGHQNQVNGVIFSPDGEILASCSADKTIYLWHHSTGKIITILKGHILGVNAIAFSPQAPLIASASADATVKIWNLTGDLITTLTAHTTCVKALSFSPSGEYLATGGEDRNIHLWDVESHQILRTLSGHPWDISALIFADSPELLSKILSKNLQPKARFNPQSNADILISGSWDKTVKLWHASTGENLDTLVGHTEAVNCIAVYQNLIISGSSDATIKLWDYTESGFNRVLTPIHSLTNDNSL